tara:strand:- start:68 stop:895 length:828 start_codon:yes stop_codon:yes gene_type:complete
MKKSLESFNYLEVASLRLVIAFLVLCPLLFYSFRKLTKSHIIPLLIISIIGTVIPAIIFAYSIEQNLNSSVAGMLNALTPIFTFIIGLTIFHKNAWKKENIIGIIIGLLGTYLLLYPFDAGLEIKLSLLIMGATICYAISINTIKDCLNTLNPVDIAVLSSFFSVIIPLFYILYNVIINGHSTHTTNTLEKIQANISQFYYLVVLGAVCTSAAILLFNYLIKRSNALFASSTTYLIPIFAIIWGLLDGEDIVKTEIIGVIIILIGVFIMNSKRVY